MSPTPLLQVQDVHKSFGGVQAVDGVSFSLQRGEMLGLIGPNGAGKSTLFHMLNGQLRPDRGSLRWYGHSLAGLRARDIWRLGVGRTFQVAQTFASLSVLENVQMVLLSHARKAFSVTTRAAAFQPDQALTLLASVGMAAQAQRACSELAYGDVKRVELAMALASSPQLLLMDEPTAGMAPDERHALMQLVQRLALERDMAVLFTEHSMDVVFGYAQRVLVLLRGQLLAQGTPEQVQNDTRVRQHYLGVDFASTASPSCAKNSATGGRPV